VETFDFPPISVELHDISPLGGGEIGVVMARAGVGKTAFLCLLALEQIRQGGRVLHVCVDETPDKIKTWYEEILRSYGRNLPRAVIKEIASSIEPLRFIASFLHNSFSLQRLQELVTNLADQARFLPSLVIIDGLDVERFDNFFFSSLKTFLAEKSLPLWMSARMLLHANEKVETAVPSPCNSIESLLDVVIVLESGEQSSPTIKVIKNRNNFPVNTSIPFVSPIFR
jgi:KaiC/GvpD/RAD55 family RecA-like ATPase